MSSAAKRLEALIREHVPQDKQPDFLGLLKEAQHCVRVEVVNAIAQETSEGRWCATELKQFADYMGKVLLKQNKEKL